jgi:hypothetical protein
MVSAMEPPPPDREWLRTTRDGGWVRRSGRRAVLHECRPWDQRAVRMAAEIGDLWRCACGRLWRYVRLPGVLRSGLFAGRESARDSEREWRPATLWQRLRYAGHHGEHEPLTAGRSFVESVRKPAHPPTCESGISAGPDGAR